MTQEQANAILVNNLLPFNFIPDFKAVEDTSLPIYNLQTDGVIDSHKWQCANGYVDKYEKPLSQGGVYPSTKEINAIFHLSSKDTQRTISGGVSTWNQNVVYEISGYGKGAVSHSTTDNKLYVSRVDNNIQPIPTDGVKNTYWTPLKNQPTFIPGYLGSALWNDVIVQLDYPERDNVYYYLPREAVTTKQKWMKIVIPYDAVYGFSDWLVVKTGLSTSEYGRLGVGSCIVKISPYDDLYSNLDHSSDYMIVYRGISSHDCSLVPLKAGIYYLYIEYTGGYAEYPKTAYPYLNQIKWICPRMVLGLNGTKL